MWVVCEYASMNTKALFAFGGGFALKSIRKICTLHGSELEKLAKSALSQSSRCFSPTQQTREKRGEKNTLLKVKVFFSYAAFCQFVIYYLQFFGGFFQRQTIHFSTLCLSNIAVAKWHQGLAGQRSLQENMTLHVQRPISHTHTPRPCPCAAFSLQKQGGLANANLSSSHALRHTVAAPIS